jgi:protein SCO1/2
MRSLCITTLLSFANLAYAAGTGNPRLPKALQGIGIDQNLNAQVPINAAFKDEAGEPVQLSQYLGRRPALLALVYYTCPMLCDQILRGVVRGIKPLALVPGKDFDVIAISINPSETPAEAAAKKKECLGLYSRHASPDGWHFLTGSEANIRAVADAVGYHYRYDPKTQTYFHAAGIMALTPEGKAARYFYGVEYEPKDLKLGLIEASHNKIGTVVDEILLFCCKYDPTTGKYTTTVLGVLKLAAAIFLAGLIVLLGAWWRRDLRMHPHARPEAPRL